MDHDLDLRSTIQDVEDSPSISPYEGGDVVYIAHARQARARRRLIFRPVQTRKFGARDYGLVALAAATALPIYLVWLAALALPALLWRATRIVGFHSRIFA
jgi:hypothetical protein